MSEPGMPMSEWLPLAETRIGQIDAELEPYINAGWLSVVAADRPTREYYLKVRGFTPTLQRVCSRVNERRALTCQLPEDHPLYTVAQGRTEGRLR